MRTHPFSVEGAGPAPPLPTTVRRGPTFHSKIYQLTGERQDIVGYEHLESAITADPTEHNAGQSSVFSD